MHSLLEFARLHADQRHHCKAPSSTVALQFGASSSAIPQHQDGAPRPASQVLTVCRTQGARQGKPPQLYGEARPFSGAVVGFAVPVERSIAADEIIDLQPPCSALLKQVSAQGRAEQRFAASVVSSLG